MNSFLLDYQTAIYATLFYGTIGVVALWESVAPRRALTQPLKLRWAGNFSILLVNTFAIWVLYPGFGIGAALLTDGQQWGLFHQWDVPGWFAFFASILLMDLSRYLEHFLLHRVPLFWRVHRTHHTDLDFDVSTAIRFHPLEAVAIIGAKVLAIMLIGAPVTAVLVYELTYPMTTFWVHGNIRMPKGWDSALRRLLVTPDMHRTHHSVVGGECNSNYGGLLSVWDRLFGTYTDEPAAGHDGMTIGLAEFRDPRHLGVVRMLANPFLQGDVSSVSVRPDPLRRVNGAISDRT